jgi:hypothetical protein
MSAFCSYLGTSVTIYDSTRTVILKIKKYMLHNYYVFCNKNKQCFGNVCIKNMVEKPKKLCLILPGPLLGQDGLHWNRLLTVPEIRYLSRQRSYPGIMIMRNKKPYYIQRAQSYVLQFKQKGGVPSVKNFQIFNDKKLSLEIVRMKRNIISVLYTAPVSPAIAFATAISYCWSSI